jgi:ribosomal protein S18 acetylase RimI-like enzyme
VIAFRETEDRDLDAVASLWKRCGLTRDWNDPYRDMEFARSGATSAILVGEIDGRLVATVMVGHDGHRGALYYLAVDPDFQKRGFGRAAVAAAEDWLRKHGVWKINLMVREENRDVGGFYESLGYAINPVVSFGKRIDGA